MFTDIRTDVVFDVSNNPIAVTVHAAHDTYGYLTATVTSVEMTFNRNGGGDFTGPTKVAIAAALKAKLTTLKNLRSAEAAKRSEEATERAKFNLTVRTDDLE